ncbi:MAG TPA: GNAT family N-acetyltransferase [Burkholderiales bacterium]
MLKVPKLASDKVVVRLTTDPEEIHAANELVCGNYINEGYWDTKEPFLNNPHMYSPMRTVFVAEQDGRILGTASIVQDSERGLPADKFQPQIMRQLRTGQRNIAEVSALAVDKDYGDRAALVLYLFKYVYQYSFYYAGIDYFVVVPTVRHAPFYQRICGFEPLSSGGQYSYVKSNVRAQLLGADLLQLHKYFYDRYDDGAGGDNFYRFLLVDGHSSLRFPDVPPLRPRHADWVRLASEVRRSRAA